MSLRKSFFVTFIVLLFMTFMIFGISFYTLSLNVLSDYAQKNAYLMVKKNNEIVDVKLKQINESVFSFISDEEVYKTFEEIAPSSDYNINLMDIRISEVLNKYFGYSEDIYSAQLATSYYTFFSRAHTTTSKNYIPKGVLRDTLIYKNASANEGKILWIPTYDFTDMFHVRYLDASNLEYRYLFSVVQMMNKTYFDGRKFLDLPENVEKPVLIINLKEEFYRQIFKGSVSIDNSLYFVMTNQGEVVSHEAVDQLAKKWDFPYTSQIISKGSGTDIITYEGQKTIMVYDQSKVTGWYAVVLIPYDSLMKKITPTIRNYVLILGIVLIIGAVFISYILAGLITKPMTQLSSAITKTGEGRFNTQVEVSGSIELRKLISKFNEMNENIQILIRENFEKDIKEKEAEILALNLQLDPHFLYNTLNLINLMLLENGEDEISELIENLSSMLKYTVKSQNGLVSFTEDMNFLKSYVGVMTKRFEGKYAVEYIIDDRLYEYEVPKFLLQPFVENIFVHAYKSSTTEATIKIVCWMDAERRYFSIEDQGKGIDDKTLRAIETDQTESIGILNVKHRIQMVYGAGFGVSIQSKVDFGTKVIICLPLIDKKS